MGTFKIFSLSNFQTSNIVLTLVTMVYILLSGHLFQNWRFVVYDPLHPCCSSSPLQPLLHFLYLWAPFFVCFQNPQFSRHRSSSLNKAWSHKPSLFHLSEETSPQTMIIELLKGSPPERDPFCYPHTLPPQEILLWENASSPHFRFPCILLFVLVELSNHWRRL